ncbi:MAG TPA: hypothetical protein VGJ91_05400 [Polyangiaceae bacterium]
MDGASAPRYLKCMGFIARAGWLACAVLLGFGAAGCGQVGGTNGAGDHTGLPSSTDASAFAKSGERLQALAYTSEGVTQFRTLHDRLLGFDCEFVSGSAGGDLHCVPKQWGQLIFLDASCSEPATWVEGEALHAGDWLSIGSSQTECPGQAPAHRDAFQVGDEVYPATDFGSAPMVFALRDTGCVAASPPAKSSPGVNRLIAQADSGLVAAKPVSVDAGGGLRLSRLLAEDGTELTVAVTTSGGEACTIQADGECVPTLSASASLGDYFTALDANCETPAFTANFPAKCGVPRFGLSGTSAETLSVHLLRPVTQLFARTPRYPEAETDPTAVSCEPANAFSNWFALGQDVTGSLPMTQRTRQGSGAVHMDVFSSSPKAGAAGVPVARYPDEPDFLDDSGTSCQVTSAVDGTLRCTSLQPTTYESGYFEDAACKQRLYYGYPDNAELSTLRVILRTDRGVLSAISTVKPYDGPVYVDSNGVCAGAVANRVLVALDQRTEVADLPLVVETVL